MTPAEWILGGVALLIIAGMGGIIVGLVSRRFNTLDNKLDVIRDNMQVKGECDRRHRDIRDNEGKLFDEVSMLKSDCAEIKGHLFN